MKNNHSSTLWNHIVIGGGFFGSQLALHLKRTGASVLLIEREDELFRRASWHNQARIHGGYHYPRSLVTAARSQQSFARFVKTFESAIDRSFRHIYAIPNRFSKVTAHQFFEFCSHIGAPIQKLRTIPSWLDSTKIEAAFEVQEFAFDASILKTITSLELEQVGVKTETSTTCRAIAQGQKNLECHTDQHSYQANNIWLVPYSAMNSILRNSKLPLIDLHLELAEICLISPPSWLEGKALTLMDGPFFSIMPFRAEKCYSVSHVRFTPHIQGEGLSEWKNTKDYKKSNWSAMSQDITHYLPLFSEVGLKRSFFETKALLPKYSECDSRPILFKRDHGFSGLNLVLGGKIDNIFDILEEKFN